MIEKRLVQWYASDAGVDLDIAEREIVLTYVLRILSGDRLLGHLAFKGGTALRRFRYPTYRLSENLDLAYRVDWPHRGLVETLKALLPIWNNGRM